MSESCYTYHGRRDLGSADLFFWIAVDETHKHLGFDDLAAASAVLLGQNDVPVPGKLRNAVAGTSAVSITARKLLPFSIRMRLPTITRAGIGGLRIAMTRNLGAFVGRAVPVVGTILLAIDVTIIMRNTVAAYNRIVRPEDKVR